MQKRMLEARKAIDSACEKLGRRINVMEVCGTHTVAIFRHGIKSILPVGLKLLSGPGTAGAQRCGSCWKVLRPALFKYLMSRLNSGW